MKAATPALHNGCQVISTRTGISFLGIVKSDGGSILKSDSVAGIVPDIRVEAGQRRNSCQRALRAEKEIDGSNV